jgi:hypothetical protein
LDLHFSDFSTICNDFSKLQLKTQKYLYSRVLESYTGNPEKSSIFADKPLAAEGARAAATVGQRRAGEWLELRLGSP